MRMHSASAVVRWRAFVERSPLRRLGHDALVAAMTSLVAKGLGFIKEVLVAALFWLVPYYFLNGVNLLGYGVLQARGRYLVNGLLPSGTPILTILILLAWGATGNWRTLTTALVVGTAFECVVLLVVLHRGNQLA